MYMCKLDFSALCKDVCVVFFFYFDFQIKFVSRTIFDTPAGVFRQLAIHRALPRHKFHSFTESFCRSSLFHSANVADRYSPQQRVSLFRSRIAPMPAVLGYFHRVTRLGFTMGA